MPTGNQIWSRLGPDVYENGRSSLQHSRESKKFRRNLFSRHHRSPRLQQNVRIVRPMYSDVLLPQQAHHD